jgi:hydrogenase maturation protease
MTERTPVLVLGLGNVLCGDDGAGVAAMHRFLRRWRAPDGVTVVDGGTQGLALLPLVDDADQVILIDAIAADAAPGALVRLEGDEVGPAVYERLSPHQIGVADLLAGAALVGRYPSRVILIGVVPQTLELGLERSPAVEARLDDLADRVVIELTALGYPPVRRDTPGPTPGIDDEVARVLGL